MKSTPTIPMLDGNTAARHGHENKTDADTDTNTKFHRSYRYECVCMLADLTTAYLVPLRERAEGLGYDIDISHVIGCLRDALADACTVPLDDEVNP